MASRGPAAEPGERMWEMFAWRSESMRNSCSSVGALLLVLAVAGVATAALIQPFGQTREVYGSAYVSLGGETQETGLIVKQAPAGDYGPWSDTAAGAVTVPGGQASFSATYNGGWNGDNALYIDSSSSNISVGGDAGVVAEALAGQHFVMQFQTTQTLDWTLEYSLGGAALTPDGLILMLEKTGEVDPVFFYQVPGPAGFRSGTGAGSIPAGEYTLTYEAESWIYFDQGPGGNGGGHAGTFNFVVTPEPATLALLILSGFGLRRR